MNWRPAVATLITRLDAAGSMTSFYFAENRGRRAKAEFIGLCKQHGQPIEVFWLPVGPWWG